jgi:hypothetical protein
MAMIGSPPLPAMAAKRLHVLAAARLGLHEAVRARGHDRLEVGLDEARAERVDAHDQHRPTPARSRALGGQPAGRGLVGRGDRVLQIEDHHVGARGEPAGDLALRVGGNEQERAHARHAPVGRLRMKAWRVHWATSVPSCL